MDQKKILFVCLGNICRSPAAEGIFQQMVCKANLQQHFVVDSAAIGPWHIGDLPDSRMRRCGEKHGYNFCSRARQLEAGDFRKFDYIIGMDHENLKAIEAKAPSEEHKKKVLLMANFLKHHDNKTIPDPYYGGERDFELVIELLEDACAELLRWLAKA